MAVITFSRQLGSAGDEIARQVCELLDYRYFDKQLMVEVAAEVGLSEQEVIDFSEERYEVRSFLSRLFRAGAGPVARIAVQQQDDTGKETLTMRELDAAECVELVRYTVLAAYETGNIVIVGRGGQAILHGKPHVLHVRVIAPQAVRIERMRQRGIAGISKIKYLLERQDRASAAYLERFYAIQWDDPAHYHLVINTDKLDVDLAAQMIAGVARQLDTRQEDTTGVVR
jgi:cytidylate kinase